MKKIINLILVFSVLVSLVACSGKNQKLIDDKASISSSSKKQEPKTSNSDSSSVYSSTDNREMLDSLNKSNSEQSGSSQSTDESALSSYSNEQVEYSRVWLVKGVHTDIDELNNVY